MSWTDERIDQLKQLWEKGLTASQIAEKLAGGISRNAVIGKAHRLGLKARPSPVKSGESSAAEAAPAAPRPTPAAAPAAPAASAAAAPSPVEAPRPKPAAPAAPRVVATTTGAGGKTSLLDLSDKICKWPIGHPGDADFHFCGKPAQPSFPYCGEHCAVAYQAQLPRRDRPGGGGRPFPPTMPGMRPR
ncbi:GcrA family cell cycle regulator [Sphingoaurantiacus capsulatus]|uniref:GcrA family cell cycle regulator n=1 Tax=Sphingoaurantiacus capsulatus TaxID=1771310 RepID=A0ABV7XBL3_9SPHN